MNIPTDKQKQAIRAIESVLDIQFEGKTKQDAFLWLREFVPKAEKVFIKNNTRIQLALENIGSINKIELPNGLHPYDCETTPTRENLDIRIAIDTLLIEKF